MNIYYIYLNSNKNNFPKCPTVVSTHWYPLVSDFLLSKFTCQRDLLKLFVASPTIPIPTLCIPKLRNQIDCDAILKMTFSSSLVPGSIFFLFLLIY